MMAGIFFVMEHMFERSKWWTGTPLGILGMCPKVSAENIVKDILKVH
jgi:hypothetical protein